MATPKNWKSETSILSGIPPCPPTTHTHTHTLPIYSRPPVPSKLPSKTDYAKLLVFPKGLRAPGKAICLSDGRRLDGVSYGTGLSSPVQREAVTDPLCLLSGGPALLSLPHIYPMSSYSPAPPQACPWRKETVSCS